MISNRRAATLALGIATAFALSNCNGSRVIAPPGRTYAISGTYQLHVVSDTFKDAAYCSNGSGIKCQTVIADTSGDLDGLFVVDDTPHVDRYAIHNGTTLVRIDSALRFTASTASLEGNLVSPTGSAFVGTLLIDSGAPSQLHLLLRNDERITLDFFGTWTHDSLIGRGEWYRINSVPVLTEYHGTLVARRRS